MPAKRTSTNPTEADLEARISELIRKALPGLSTKGVKHQTTFSIKFGKKTLSVISDVSSARSDILLVRDGQNLAIVELKREGIELTPEDSEQGLSYARVLHPRPPIVIISNGKDTKVLETATGSELEPKSLTEEKFVGLVVAAAKMSRSEVESSIEGLMGTDPRFWAAAFQLASEITFDELTGGPNENSMFLDGFLLSRAATDVIIETLDTDKKLVLVRGAPFSGKSHVLRDLYERLKDSEQFVVLYISCDHGEDIIQTIADALGAALDCVVSTETTRQWLRNIGDLSSPSLILAIDELSIYRPEWVSTIKDLTSSKFGKGLRTIVALDDGLAEKLLQKESGRGASQLARRVREVSVGQLNDNEFRVAASAMNELQIGFMHGAFFTNDYRIPWVMRTIVADTQRHPNFGNEELFAFLLPIFGANLIQEAGVQQHDSTVKIGLREVGAAILEELENECMSPDVHIQSLNTFLTRRRKLLETLPEAEVRILVDQGYIKLTEVGDGEPVYVVRTPEILASVVAELVSKEIEKRAKNDSLAQYLVKCASSLPMGDVIASSAISQASVKIGQIPKGLIEALLESEPEAHSFSPGTKMLLAGPNGTNLSLETMQNGRLAAYIDGRIVPLDDEELSEDYSRGYSNFHSWLILAHLCHNRMQAEYEGGNSVSVEGGILLHIGKAKMPVRRPEKFEKIQGILTHEIDDHGSIVCHKIGIVEPITQAIYLLLGREQSYVEAWIAAAIEEKSFALLARIKIALNERIKLEEGRSDIFLPRILEEEIKPAKDAFLPIQPPR